MSTAMLRFAVILGLLSTIGPSSIDMYLPALPAIASDLNTTEAGVQVTITSYFIALGIAQMIYGPWSDQAGRRVPMMVGLSLFMLASIGAATAQTLPTLAAWRALQGLGGASVMVVTRAVIRDQYTGAEATRLMALVMLVISISPMLAPLAGTGILAVAEWRAIFWALCAVCMAGLALVAFMLPETLPPERRAPVNLAFMRRGSLLLLTDPYFMGLTFIGALGMSSFFVYLSSAPFVYTGQFGLSSTQFSLAFALNALGFFAASQAAGPLAARIGLTRAIHLGTGMFAAFSGLLAVVTLTTTLTLPVLMALLFLANAGLGLVIPTTFVKALDPHGEIAGLASSLGGTMQLLMGAAMVALTGPFFDGTATAMVVVIALCGLCALVLARATLKAPAK